MTRPLDWRDNTGWDCPCGRSFKKRAGLLIHGRTCPTEAARSRDFLAIVEANDPEMKQNLREDYEDRWGA